MKTIRQRIEGIVAGLLLAAVLLPIVSMAARVTIPVFTGLTLTSTLNVNLVAPSIVMGTATTTYGSVSTGTIAFTITALDGSGGESLPVNSVATSSILNGAGYALTWASVQGATAYRVYFSTSTSPSTQTFTQYFLATTSNQFTFLSTSTPVFVSGLPTSNGAYVVKLPSSGSAWINSGLFAFGSSTPVATLQVTATSSNATTSLQVGKAGQTKGTCLTIYTATGTPVYMTVQSYSGGVPVASYTDIKPSGCAN